MTGKNNCRSLNDEFEEVQYSRASENFELYFFSGSTGAIFWSWVTYM